MQTGEAQTGGAQTGKALAHRLVVVGTSAGGVAPLTELVAGLPADFPAALCIVMHIPAYAPSALPDILSRAGHLSASHPVDGEAVLPGRIYCAPPDHHLLIEGDHFAVTRGPKENRARPAVDTLFRSAAYSHGPNVIGVILSGLLDDGTSGLWTIKHFGGTSIVQDGAEYDSMPRSAASQVSIDYSVRSGDLAALLTRLSAQPPDTNWEGTPGDDHKQRVATEISIASSAQAYRKGVMDFGKVTPQTCPDCGGVLIEIREGGFTRYRCHTGHAYSGDTLLVSVTEGIEDKLWQTMRALEEASMLLENTGRDFERAGNVRLAQIYAQEAEEMEARTRLIFENVVHNKSLSTQRLELEALPRD